MADQRLLTRDEVLGGLPAKRASALLFLIESRTARAAARARQATERFLTPEAARERDLAYVEAFALGREPPRRLTIQDLERYAPDWADLVPDNPRLRAAVARLLARKYPFSAAAAPRVRAALGLDQAAVQTAYQRLYPEPLTAIYAPRESLPTRVRWALTRASAWLESLPPFWTAFALTLTETVGQGILALPIALAGIGVVPGIALLVVLGLVNVVTVAALAETVTRTASVRYFGAFFQRIVDEYLGRAGSVLLTWVLVTICAVSLLGYHIGLSTTMDRATGVPAAVWMALLFALDVYVLSRKSLNSTIASALAVGAINLGLIALLVLLALTHLHPANLGHADVPWLNGRPFDRSVLGIVFGVILVGYFGHTSIGYSARVVLNRDPSGRSLIWGAVAAQLTAVAVYSLWLLAVIGAVAPSHLIGEDSTSLPALAKVVGPAVYVFGSVFVLLGMGMGSIHFSLGLFNVVRDWLPARAQSVVLLPRASARLLFQPRGASDDRPRVALTYSGLDGGRPRFVAEVDDGRRSHRVEATVTERWRLDEELAKVLPGGWDGSELTLQVFDADERQARVRVATSLAMTYDGDWEYPGLQLGDVTGRDGADWPLLRWMLRRGDVSAGDLATETGEDPAVAANRLRAFEARGLVRAVARNGERRYHRVKLAPRRGRRVPDETWLALGLPPAPPAPSRNRGRDRPVRRRLGAALMDDRGRSLLGMAPAAIAFLLAEWLVLTNRASFTAILSFGGLVATSVFAGTFATLLLVSSRHRGDLVPGTVYRALGHPALMIGIYALFLGGIFLHRLVIWRATRVRVGAVATGVIALAVTIISIRRGAFARRIVLSLHAGERPEGALAFGIVAGGVAQVADVRLDYADGEQRQEAFAGTVPALTSLRSVRFAIPADGAREIKVWTLRTRADGGVEGLPQRLRIVSGERVARSDPRLSDGQAVLPLIAGAPAVEVVLGGGESA